MSSPRSMSLLRHVSLLSAAVFLAVGAASAQVTLSHEPSVVDPSSSSIADSSSSSAASESSSSAPMPLADDASVDGAALPGAPAASGAGAGQDSGYHHHSLFSHLAFEAGGGFNAPANDPYITWGGNFTLGAGYRFSPRVTLLTEYQFIDDKLPGALIAETGA